jgi:hypothetical protein
MKRTLQVLVILSLCLGTSFFSYAQVPVLNSDPNSAATIYLDFDGQYVAGTSWNWSGPINAAPANLSAAAITEIFTRVAEDYRPITVNVTTDSNRYLRAPILQRMRVIVTASSAWYGRAGGVAFVGSFSWGDNTPTWIFSDLLYNNPKYVAEACAHEAGHTLGLQHQSKYDENCMKISEYNGGAGNGEIGWAPIMGVGYNQNLTTWHTGPSSEGCNVIQNDLSIITSAANGLKFRDDDFGNNPLESTPITMHGTAFQINGQISKMKDVDAFRFELTKPNGFRLMAIPQNVGTGNLGADVDLKIYIMNSKFDTVGIYNPSQLLDAVIDTTLNQGVYYISIGATGNAYHSDYGSLGYYSLAGSLQSILPVYDFTLKANDQRDNRILAWTYTSDEKLAALSVESSLDGKNFKALSTVSAAQRSYVYNASRVGAYYRMKATTLLTGVEYYSNIVYVDGKANSAAPKVINTLVKQSILISSGGNYAYQLLDMSGAQISAGQLIAGMNSIDASRCKSGIFLIRMSNGTESYAEKLMKD